MRILVVCQHYKPEPMRITDICEELVKRGNDVTVLTGVPNYPMGIIYEGYRHGQRRKEVINGVKVIRSFTIGRRTGAFWRILNYFSYAISASIKAGKLGDQFDVVFVNQTSPVMMAWPGIRYKKKYKKKLVVYCMDLWPESLEAGGIKKGSPVYKLFHWISEKTYKQADRLLVTSRTFNKYFEEEFGMNSEEIIYMPQYAEDLFSNMESNMDKEKTPDDEYNFVFAGNVGKAQSVETIIEAANLLKDKKNIKFHIVGNGSALEHCKEMAKEYGLTSVIFHGRRPVEEMPKYYAMADAMLITMFDNEMISKTLPGKVQTYMAAGKHIIGAINGETRRAIEEAECGICGPAEAAEIFSENILNFIESNKKKEMAFTARDFYEKNFTKELFMKCLADQLK